MPKVTIYFKEIPTISVFAEDVQVGPTFAKVATDDGNFSVVPLNSVHYIDIEEEF